MIGEIVSVVTSAGEIVGRLKHDNDKDITITNPRSIMIADGGAGFAPSLSMAGERDPKEVTINRSHVVFMTKTNDTVNKVWIQQTSGLVI
jgi:hypothetical protein